MNGKRKVMTMSFTMPIELAEQVRTKAENLDISMSKLVSIILEQNIKTEGVDELCVESKILSSKS